MRASVKRSAVGPQARSRKSGQTQIDWENGILGVPRPWATARGLDVDDEQLLAEAFRRTGTSLGVAVDATWAARLGDSVPDWPEFPDSSAALAVLAEYDRLIIVCDVHRAGFAAINRRLHGDFAAIITAEDVALTSRRTTTSSRSSSPRWASWPMRSRQRSALVEWSEHQADDCV